MYVCEYIYIHIYVCVCIYICTCMCVHIYVHINHISKQKGDDKYEGVGSFTYKGNRARAHQGKV